MKKPIIQSEIHTVKGDIFTRLHVVSTYKACTLYSMYSYQVTLDCTCSHENESLPIVVLRNFISDPLMMMKISVLLLKKKVYVSLHPEPLHLNRHSNYKLGILCTTCNYDAQ